MLNQTLQNIVVCLPGMDFQNIEGFLRLLPELNRRRHCATVAYYSRLYNNFAYPSRACVKLTNVLPSSLTILNNESRRVFEALPVKFKTVAIKEELHAKLMEQYQKEKKGFEFPPSFSTWLSKLLSDQLEIRKAKPQR